MKKLLLPGLTIGTLMLGMSQANAASLVVIDNFDFANSAGTDTTLTLRGNSSPAVKTTNPTNFTRQASAPINTATNSNILGGERNLTFTRTFANAATRTGSVTIDPDAVGIFSDDPGTLSISNGTNFNSRTTLLYNGIGNAGLNADLSNQDFFALVVEDIDLNVRLSLTVVDNNGTTSTLSETSTSTTPGIVDFLFEEFVGIDFSSVRSVALVLDGPNAFDAEINGFNAQPIPESSTVLGTFLVTALGLGGLARRSKESRCQNT